MGENAGRGAATTTLSDRKAIGQQAEAAACAFLEAKGLRLLQRNYLCRFGEIDLIMRDKSKLVFIEVRCRKPSIFGTAIDTVVHSKQQKLIKTALCYLRENRLSADLACRFDVVGVTPAGRELQIQWIQDAFQADD